MARRCCDEHDRAALLRRVVSATAGKGLPAIERGMPLPAGTGLDRRAFLARSAGLMLAVYGASHLRLPALEEGIASAAAAATPTDPVLVTVFLDGGIDALSVLAPVGDPLYRKLRPTLALPADGGTPFAEDGRLRWHPAAAPLASLHAEGKLSVAPALGYTHPDQSHFTSRHFYEVGATSQELLTGWLGRMLDLTGADDNPLQGLSLDDTLQPSLAAARVPVAAVASPDDYGLWAANVWDDVETRMLDAIAPIGAASVGRGDAALEQVGRPAVQVDGIRRALLPFVPPGEDRPGWTSPVAYPTDDDPFPKRLSGLAAMLGAGLPLRCVALTAPGGYDTHDGQPRALREGLDLTARSLLAFQRDLEARGLADRVLVLVWSEFGRRAEQNDSEGTDHGAAGIGFVLGARARGTMIGEWPGLAAGSGLDDDGNTVPTADFRGLYAALLEQWLGVDAAAVLPDAARFARPEVVR
ncbi:MAG: DUF1501 domain-containing protein [Thermoleophilia bacterium]